MLLLAAIVAAAAGCADEELPRLGDYLEGLELDVPLESTADVPFGKFDVPLAVATAAEGKPDKKIWMRLRFELTAEAAPKSEAAVLSAYERRRGAINDAILTIVRNSSVDDLTDPRLAAIKSRMTEAVRPLLGQQGIRQLVLNDIATEPL